MAAKYKVKSAYVTLRVPVQLASHSRGGYTSLGFYGKALVPADAHPKDVERLLAKGAIEPIEEVETDGAA